MNALCDLILIRHEETEGNAALHKSGFGGDSSGFTSVLRSRSSDTWRLSENGRRRCIILRDWIKNNVSMDNGLVRVVSPLIRAQETANLILPGTTWMTDELVRNRVWGGIECVPWNEWPAFCNVNRHDELPSGFHQAYPQGEAMSKVWQRTKEFIDSLERSALVVTHGEVVEMSIMHIENVHEKDYRPPELKRDGSHIRNGHVVWYSKRNPWTEEILQRFSFKKMWFDGTDQGWSSIV